MGVEKKYSIWKDSFFQAYMSTVFFGMGGVLEKKLVLHKTEDKFFEKSFFYEILLKMLKIPIFPLGENEVVQFFVKSLMHP